MFQPPSSIADVRGMPAMFVLSALIAPGSAVAAQPGVTYDPRSPAGKEYALPLDSARGVGTGSNAGTSPGRPRAEAPPVFGAGITPAQPSPSPAHARKANRLHTSSRHRSHHKTAGKRSKAVAKHPPRALPALSANQGGLSPLWAGSGIALIAAAVAAALGVGWRRLRRPS